MLLLRLIYTSIVYCSDSEEEKPAVKTPVTANSPFLPRAVAASLKRKVEPAPSPVKPPIAVTSKPISPVQKTDLPKPNR